MSIHGNISRNGKWNFCFGLDTGGYLMSSSCFFISTVLEDAAGSTDLGDFLGDVVSSVYQLGRRSDFTRRQRHKGVRLRVQQTLGHLPFTLGTQDRTGVNKLIVRGT